MDSYLIRIYRREKDNPDAIVGTIEEIGVQKIQPFKNLSDLSKIIAVPKQRIRRTTKKKSISESNV